MSAPLRLKDAVGLAGAGAVMCGALVATIAMVVVVLAAKQTVSLGLALAEANGRTRRGKA